MKKKLSALLAAFALTLSLAACGTAAPASTPPGSSADTIADRLAQESVSRITADVTLDASAHSLHVTQQLIYRNDTGSKLQSIYVNLIPNAFASSGGGITIASTRANGADTELAQVDGTVYSIALPEALESGKDATLDFDYTVSIPNIENRFGWQDGIINAGNFLITPCVFENGAWVVEPYVDIGDAFYTDIADYSVTLHLPDGWAAASAGEPGEDGAYHGRMRDYVFCASDGFKTLSDTVDGVDVTVYYRDKMDLTAKRTFETASNSLALYNDILGRYPYSNLTLVLSGLTSGVSGTEYPTLVMVGPEIPLEGIDQTGAGTSADYNGYCWELDRTVTHEVAHQWMYGIVGNDQIRYPWLDEGFCRFAEQLYMEAYPPAEPRADWVYDISDLFRDEYDMLTEATAGMSANMNWTLYDWIGGEPSDYGEIYTKGASLWYMLRDQMGSEAFCTALREYVDEFAWQFVTPDAFKAFWNERGDFAALFKQYGI